MMNIKQKLFLLLFVVPTVNFVWSQQEAAFSLYMFNHQSINPAYVGAQDHTQITVLNRAQWNGIIGSPETQAISVGHQFKNKNLGLGFSSIVDKIGPVQNTNASLDLAYHLSLNDKNLRLGLGLKLSGRSYQLDNSMLTPFDSSDRVFTEPINSKFLPNIGMGAYLHNEKFYVGISLPYLLEDIEVNLKRNYYLFFGGLLNSTKKIQFKPSFLFQKTEILPLTYDMSILIVANDKFWIGPQLRTTSSGGVPGQKSAGFYGAIAGFHINDNLSLGYAYQGATMNKNLGITNNSHELFLRFNLVPKVSGILRSPRLF
ncbi:MAG: hypothetical protein CMC41_06875 [Flavobacteriaceae bacterium]|nr:hypothetical protein [Flavobacteriaceae bacterium]